MRVKPSRVMLGHDALKQGASDLEQLRELLHSGLFSRCGRLLANPDDRRNVLQLIVGQFDTHPTVAKNAPLRLGRVEARRRIERPRTVAARKAVRQ